MIISWTICVLRWLEDEQSAWSFSQNTIFVVALFWLLDLPLFRIKNKHEDNFINYFFAIANWSSSFKNERQVQQTLTRLKAGVKSKSARALFWVKSENVFDIFVL